MSPCPEARVSAQIGSCTAIFRWTCSSCCPGFCLMLPVARARSLRGGWRTFLQSARAPHPAAALCHDLCGGGRADRARDARDRIDDPGQRPAPARHLAKPERLDGPLWSVALEYKIYFLFPVFVWLWLRFGASVVLVAAGAISAVLYAVVMPIPLIAEKSHICPWYVFLFALGMIATDFASRPEETPTKKWLLPLLLAVALACLAATLWAWPITSGAARRRPTCRTCRSSIRRRDWSSRCSWRCWAARRCVGGHRRRSLCCHGSRWSSWGPSDTAST